MTTIYLPFIINNNPNNVLDLTNLFINDPEQNRTNITYNNILSRVAMLHAEDMANRNYYSHVTPEGLTPNQWVRMEGYILPSNYSNGNNIESINAGRSNVNDVWQSWKDSPPHRNHVLGIGFFQNQNHYGIGYAHNENSLYLDYWVLITAP
jgi:uncharacterized protein YkwD